MNKVRVLGVDLYAEGLINSISHILGVAQNRESQNHCVSATGAHGMITAKKDVVFRDILQSFYMNLPDGMPGVWVGRLKGAKKMTRCYGPDFFKEMMIQSAERDVKHFLCGGMDGVAEKLELACEEKFGNSNIVGTYCPPFLPVEKFDYQEIGEEINKTAPDVVWIGLSTPKQEQFASFLSKYTQAKFIICVGAAFDFHIGNVQQAPAWMQRIGMEWFFRLLVEPKRLWKRYIEIVPLFILYNFAELFSGKFYKK